MDEERAEESKETAGTERAVEEAPPGVPEQAKGLEKTERRERAELQGAKIAYYRFLQNIRSRWPYAAVVAVPALAGLWLLSVLDRAVLENQLDATRRALTLTDNRLAAAIAAGRPTCETPQCPVCAECPECEKCENCEPTEFVLPDGSRLPNGVCFRPRITVRDGTEQHFWLDTSFHFPGDGDEWRKLAPVGDDGFHDVMLGYEVYGGLWDFLNQGPTGYRFRPEKTDFKWSWRKGGRGQKVAYNWRPPRIDSDYVELDVTICMTLRDWQPSRW